MKWTLNKLLKLQRISRDGKISLLGLFIKANDENDKKMIDLTMKVMVIQEENLNRNKVINV
tara:strand:- start:277 stop:459 length:183 start_codon:yes stop_codon:yes gene_type:complete